MLVEVRRLQILGSMGEGNWEFWGGEEVREWESGGWKEEQPEKSEKEITTREWLPLMSLELGCNSINNNWQLTKLTMLVNLAAFELTKEGEEGEEGQRARGA